MECASFKSWSSFILVLYTAFEFYFRFSVLIIKSDGINDCLMLIWQDLQVSFM
ncbi:hypothetical protein VCRA2128O305_210062 [Vibrio crassostreae]|nr:hypothetical protein VCRA2112O187_10230001 [Vibrio crassostreae]CAK1759927.1 hypothetical protein VCRA2113O222_150026 [Vibrio crassostreae]CAK1782799.1 hypothetical protein VCRA2116O234_160033 [Vibrio crassostreae]CAK1786088.1 hypothetical protein VCRA2113O213_160060 [Vibrio crassostreae]CAK1790362.1 hypothetical protein VCRA2113O221_160033 [Vibrio crassostreae]